MRNLTLNFSIKNDQDVEVKGCKATINMAGAGEEDIAKLLERSQSLLVAIQNGGVRKLSASAIRDSFVTPVKGREYSWKGPFSISDPEKEAKQAEAALGRMSDEALLALLEKRGIKISE